jgi:hypothetical protein
MMASYSTSRQSELGAEAKGEAYFEALARMAFWAIESAIRKWHRGHCGKNQLGRPYDYGWPPVPADLRRIAWAEMYRVKARALTLDQLLSAEARIEIDEEQRRRIGEGLATLARKLGSSLVGKDGSGGAVGKKPAGAHCGTQPKAKPGLKREGGCRRRGDRRK